MYIYTYIAYMYIQQSEGYKYMCMYDVKSPPISPVKCLDHSHSFGVLLAKL